MLIVSLGQSESGPGQEDEGHNVTNQLNISQNMISKDPPTPASNSHCINLLILCFMDERFFVFKFGQKSTLDTGLVVGWLKSCSCSNI